jgi:agmatinase
MSNLELYTSQTNIFGGIQKPFEKAEYVILGIPFDSTSTYRSGARFGPSAIRQASLNIETYSFRSGVDLEDLNFFDAGDLNVSMDAKETVDLTELVIADILAAGKIPVALCGEHTATLGIVKGLGSKASETAIVSFDAHLDLRSEFMDLTLSHTTFMHMISKQVKPAKIIEVGTRSACKEELVYSKKSKVDFFTSQQIIKQGSEQVIEELKAKLEPFERVYLTVDIDVLDPAYAPAVQNPEPEGISPTALLDIACALCGKRLIGFDVLEVTPAYDQGVTAIVAAKIMFELLCQLEKSRKNL